MKLDRRSFLAGAGALVIARAHSFASPWPGRDNPKEIASMAHELAPLPYDAAALEPHIDAQTMQIH
ncbi:MAG: superoxide dismutase, partial [Vicinamibacteria bacterium]